jgi:2-succinyl-6-hydroxy-2,4-cyclohexadiene-1-carboxylate synthase
MTHPSIYLRPYNRTETGIPVLFVHGFMGSSADWEDLASGLSAPAFGIDLPGHGFTRGVEGDASWFEKTVLGIHDALEKRNITEINLVGYSLGGRVALHLASEFPGLVRRLVLESCHPGLELPSEKESRLFSDARWGDLFRSNWPSVVDDWYEQDVFRSFSGDLDTLKAGKLGNDPELLSEALNGFSLGRQDSKWETKHRSLYITGRQDAKYVEIGQKLTLISPNTSLFVVDEAGHNVHLERPEAYLAALNQFLELDFT